MRIFIHEEFYIDQLTIYPDLNNTVKAVHYTVSFDNLLDCRICHTNCLLLPAPGNTFIPYQDLTEAIVKGWILTLDKINYDVARNTALNAFLNSQGSAEPQVLPDFTV